MTKTILILLTGLLFLSCKDEKNNTVSLDENIKSELWEDKTETYLPITGEWTNRVEVADINGDKIN